jgi:hypothetical protein
MTRFIWSISVIETAHIWLQRDKECKRYPAVDVISHRGFCFTNRLVANICWTCALASRYCIRIPFPSFSLTQSLITMQCCQEEWIS